MTGSIIVVEFESDKSGIRHLCNKLKDYNGTIFDCLGDPVSKDPTKVKQIIYVGADEASQIKKEIDSWLRDNFRVGTTFPKVSIIDTYASEELYDILKKKDELTTSCKISQQNEAKAASLLQELEAKESLLDKEYQKVELVAKDMDRVKDLEQKLKIASATEEKLRDSENAVEKLQGVCNEYFSQLRAAKKRLDEYDTKPSTPESLNIEAVRNSASALLAIEKELQNIAPPMNLDLLLKILEIPESLIEYVNSELVNRNVYVNDADIREELIIKPFALDDADKKIYDEAKKAVNFYETIKKSNIDLPEEIKQTFSQLEATIEDKKSIVSQVESKRKEYEFACEKVQKLQVLVNNYDLMQKAKSVLATAKIRIYSNIDKNKNTTVYVPVGSKESFVYKIIEQELVGETPNLDEHGVVTIRENKMDDADLPEFIHGVSELKNSFKKYFKQVEDSMEIIS